MIRAIGQETCRGAKVHFQALKDPLEERKQRGGVRLLLKRIEEIEGIKRALKGSLSKEEGHFWRGVSVMSIGNCWRLYFRRKKSIKTLTLIGQNVKI